MRIAKRLLAGAGPPAAAALAYLALAVLWAAPSSLSPTDTVPDLGDPLHLAWTMAWDAHQLVRRPWALFDSNGFYPYPGSLAFADHLLPEAVLVAPMFWLTGNAVLALNAAVVLALALSALTMFLLVRHLTRSSAAAFLAGLVYAFNSFTLHELPRVHVLNAQWWPLALLFLDRLARQGRPRDAWLFAAAAALQGLSGTYYLLYTILLGPLWLFAAYLATGRRPSWREARSLLTALLVAGAGLAAILWPYLAQFRIMGFERSWAAGADLLSYLDPDPRNWLWGNVDIVAGRSELPHFLGFLGCLLMVLGAARVVARRGEGRGAGLLALLTGGAGLVLSLGPLIHVGGVRLGGGPYDFLYHHVPLARGMASPERIGVLVILGGAVLAGLGLVGLLEAVPARLRPWAVGVLAVLLPLEHWSPPRPAAAVPSGAHVSSAYRWLAGQAPEPVIELPLYPDRARKQFAAYLYFSTYHWRPIPIGRTSFYPPAHDFLAWSLRGFPDDTSLTLLDTLGIRTVVVHPLVWEADERAGKLAALDAEPRLQLERSFEDVLPERFAPLGLGQERVYRVVSAAAPPGVLCEPADEVPREDWTFRSTGVNKPERVRDGDRRTAWFTARPQRPGDRLEVDLGRPETLAVVCLDIDYPHEEFTRNLVLVVRGEDGEWRRVAYADGPEERWATLTELLERPREARWVLRIPPQTVTGLRLAVGFREEDAAWPRWAVPELRLYRDCR